MATLDLFEAKTQAVLTTPANAPIFVTITDTVGVRDLSDQQNISYVDTLTDTVGITDSVSSSLSSPTAVGDVRIWYGGRWLTTHTRRLRLAANWRTATSNLAFQQRMSFGTLQTSGNAAAEAAAGQRLAMVDLKWEFWQNTALDGVGVRNPGTYVGDIKATVQAALDSGMRVSLGLGLHFPPAWIASTFPTTTKYTNEIGGVSTSIDLVWSKKGRELAEAYIADVKAAFGATMWAQIWAVRIASGAGNGEITYPQGEGGTAGPAFTWGTLVAPTTNITAQVAAGQRRAMVELNWGYWQLTAVGGVGVRNTTTTYCATTKATIQAWVDAGVSVTLGLGLHFLPLWVFTDHPTLVRFTDQNGTLTPLGTTNGSSGSIDIVWSAKGAELYQAYLADLKAYLGDALWGQIAVIRIAIATRNGEVTYPQDGGYSWRGFSDWAQNGGTNLAGYARSSSDTVASGGAGFAGAPTTNAQVQAHTKWYIDSLVRCCVEQQRYLTENLGYTKRFEYVMPGSGVRPSSWNSLQAMATLPAGSLAGVGAAWFLVAAGAGYKTRTSIHCSSTADGAGTPADNVPVTADKTVPVLSTAPSTNSWSAARWTQRLAYEHGMQWSAENPGAGTPPSAHYMDTTSTGLLAKMEAIITAGVQVYGKGMVAGGYWAHDSRLWDGTLSYNLFAAAMQRIAALPGPPYQWWGFSTWAQGGGSNLAVGQAGVAAVPASALVADGGAGVIAGVPPSGSPPQVAAWYDWYIESLGRCIRWQQEYLISLGFVGWFELVSPGVGTRPATVLAIRTTFTALPAGADPVVGSPDAAGTAWQLLFSTVAYAQRTAVQCSTVASSAGDSDLPVTADKAISVTSTTWSPGSFRWQIRLAHEYGLKHRGENPGYTAGTAAYYSGMTATGMMPITFDLLTAAGNVYGQSVQDGFYWAHDGRLWDGTIPYSEYSTRFRALSPNAPGLPTYPTPPGPSSFGGSPFGSSTFGDPA